MGHSGWGEFGWGGTPWGGDSLATLRERRRAHIAWLVDVQLLAPGAPLLKFSDINIDYVTDRYDRYIMAIGGVAQELERASSDSLNSPINITFRNGPWRAFSNLIEVGETYPFEGAAVTVKSVHLDDEKNPTDAEIIFQGILEEPRAITRRDFTCRAASVEFIADLRT